MNQFLNIFRQLKKITNIIHSYIASKKSITHLEVRVGELQWNLLHLPRGPRPGSDSGLEREAHIGRGHGVARAGVGRRAHLPVLHAEGIGCDCDLAINSKYHAATYETR